MGGGFDKRDHTAISLQTSAEREAITPIIAILMLLWTIALCGPYFIELWRLDERGFSALAGTVPYWDFSNLWAGSKLARLGETAALFDVELYRQRLTELLGVPINAQEWSYPPSILLIGVPLSYLPIGIAYVVWTFGTLAGFVGSLCLMRLPVRTIAVATLSPALALSALLGQNGALTGALLIAGLVLAPHRPWLGGFLIGLLCIKPHMAILVPIVFLAAGNWRAILSAGLTVAVLILAMGFLFGFESWALFFAETRQIMTRILEAPYGAGHHVSGISIFLMARSFGAGLPVAYAAQIIAIALVAIAVWLLWWKNKRPSVRVIAATLILSGFALPYGYTYDLAALSAGAVIVMQASGQANLSALAGWMWPALVRPTVLLLQLSLSPLVFLPLAIIAWLSAWRMRDAEGEKVPQ
ncbi:MAG TPA: glycosyltransferase family 87 protein [Beijerinckiaceae bacterium]|jgi:hypothetical protein|nr:glycosyltransferase family 87 protein [Beijerinckiaceae bacterium]